MWRRYYKNSRARRTSLTTDERKMRNEQVGADLNNQKKEQTQSLDQLLGKMKNFFKFYLKYESGRGPL